MLPDPFEDPTDEGRQPEPDGPEEPNYEPEEEYGND